MRQQQLQPWTIVSTFTTQALGIDDVDGIVCSIYPNPASHATTISVSGANDKVKIELTDINGRKIVSEAMESNSDCVKTMDVDHLAQGTYFVRITGDNDNMVQKLIVR